MVKIKKKKPYNSPNLAEITTNIHMYAPILVIIVSPTPTSYFHIHPVEK